MLVSSGLYAVISLLCILALPWQAYVAAQSLDSMFIGTAIVLSIACVYLSCAAFKSRAGTKRQKARFGIAAGVFCGVMTSFGGWSAGLIFGTPLFVALLDRDLWSGQ
jgi:hypothetical protein